MLLYTIHRTAVDLVVEKTLRCSLTKIIKIYQFCSVCAPPPHTSSCPPSSRRVSARSADLRPSLPPYARWEHFAFLVVWEPHTDSWCGKGSQARNDHGDTQHPRQSPKRPR